MKLLTAGPKHQAEISLGRFPSPDQRLFSPNSNEPTGQPYTSTPRLDAPIAWLVRPTAIRGHPLAAQIEVTVAAGHEDIREPVLISFRIVSPKMAAAALSSHRGGFYDGFPHIYKVAIFERECQVGGSRDQQVCSQPLTFGGHEVSCARYDSASFSTRAWAEALPNPGSIAVFQRE
jgi:hypothetical protein